MSKRILRFTSILGVGLACAGCEILTAPGSPGIAGRKPLITGYIVGAYDWSADGKTIYFTAATGEQNRGVGVWRVDASSGRVSTLASTLPGSSGMWQTLRVAGAGGAEKVYVAISQTTSWCNPGTIFRLPGGGGVADTLATDVDNAMFVTSRDGAHVAFTAVAVSSPPEPCPAGRDSFVVLSTTAAPAFGRRAVERGLSSFQIQPLSISAGGSLVYARTVNTSGAYYTVVYLSPAGGSSREVLRMRQGPVDTIQVLSTDIVWRGETPTLLLTRTVQGQPGADVLSVDGGTGALTLQVSVPDAISPTSPAQSADGAAWAAWFVVKDLTPNNVERHNLRYRLYAKTPEQPGLRVLAEVEGYEGPWKLQVSPDGRRVSFLNRELYVLSME